MGSFENLKLFLAAALIVNLVPGVDRFFVAAVSIREGVRSGVLASLGITFGTFVHSLLAAFGLLVILTLWPWTFVLVKLTGALFLMALGSWIMFADHQETPSSEKFSKFRLNFFWQGSIVHSLNPIAAIFILTFIPQFIEPSAHFALQFIVLSAISNFMGTSINCISAYIFGRVGDYFDRHKIGGKIIKYVSGFALAMFGVSQWVIWWKNY